MKKGGFHFLVTAGLFMLIGQVFADEPSQATTKQIRPSNKGHFATMSSGRTYSSTMSSDRKTTIKSSDGKIVAEEICSPNKRFYAFADLDKAMTTIYEIFWQGNIGRRKESWAMDGCFEMLGLLNDGKHLVVGYQGTSIIPVDYKKDQVILSFLKCGKLIHQVRLNQLIINFAKLKKVASGYYWGKYLGLNSAGYYVIESVEGEKFIFNAKTGKQVTFTPNKFGKLPNWKTYRDIMRCYEFQYPDNYLFKEYLTHDARPTGSTALETENTGCRIMTSVEEIARYFSKWYDPAKMSFEEFAIDRAKVKCSADGPYSSRYATDVVRKKVFTNPHDLKGVEFYLVEVHETHFEDNEEVKIEKRIKGPIYAVSISQTDEPYRALIFEFNNEGEDLFQEKKILKKIINTVKIFR